MLELAHGVGRLGNGVGRLGMGSVGNGVVFYTY